MANQQTQVDVSVIVVNYHSSEEIRKCLTHLGKSEFTGSFEVLLVNNSPGDGIEKMLTEFPDVILIAPDKNLGFGPACNQAFHAARGAYMLLINPDAYIPNNAVQQGIDYFKSHPKVAVIGAQLLSAEGELPQPSARCFPTLLDKFFMLSGLASRYPKSRLFGRVDMTWWDHSHAQRVDWVVGAYFMIRTEMGKKLDWFDERFFLYFEELDLCRRIRDHGWEVHYLPQIRVPHVGGACSQDMDPSTVDGAQITIFRLFAEALYYGKYQGRLGALFRLGFESAWTRLRWFKNRLSGVPAKKEKARVLLHHIRQIRLSLQETRYGQKVPDHPWHPDPRSYPLWKE